MRNATTQATAMAVKKVLESAPLGRARRAVRGFIASSLASRRRLADIARVRAAIMQARMRRIFVGVMGWAVSLAARKVARMAQGRAKRVWEILMSAAKRESLEIADCGLRVAD